MLQRAEGAPLREDLRALAGECGAEPVEVQRISPLEAPRHRGAAYRIRLSDGRWLKGRELRDEASAARVVYVLRHAPHPAFLRLLGRRGAALLLEWIEGVPVDPDPDDSVVREAADFLAATHATPVPADCPLLGDRPADSSSRPSSRQAARVARHVEQLVRAGALDERAGAALCRLLEALRPAGFERGFVHGDLCAENLVIDRAGRVRVVDNEALGVGPCDGDLARTLYRWPLSQRGADVLLDTYARRRSIDAFLAHFGYWALAARLGSAAHRIGAPAEVAQVPLRSLAHLLSAIEDGKSGETLLIQSLTGR